MLSAMQIAYLNRRHTRRITPQNMDGVAHAFQACQCLFKFIWFLMRFHFGVKLRRHKTAINQIAFQFGQIKPFPSETP